MNSILIPLIGGSVGVPIIIWLFWWLIRESPGTARMKEIAGYIQEGAHAYLKREFVTISYVIIPFAIILFFILGWEIAFGFFLGSLFSIIAIITGMSGALIANVRTANAARTPPPGRSLILAFLDNYGWNAVMFPLYLRGTGKVATIIGVFSVRKWEKRGPLTSLNIGLLSALISKLILFYILTLWFMKDIRIFYCLSVGILSLFIGALIVQYYTGIDRSPVKKIARGSQTGTPIGILTGFSYGLESAMFSMLLIGGVIILGYQIMGGGLLGIFGLAMATLGMTEMKGMMQSIDTYGPISDNAAGIAEMSGISKEARKSLDTRDAAGNVSKAITKGYGLTKCILSSIVILFAYIFVLIQYQGITMNDISDIALHLNLANPHIIVTILIGASIPFLFSALLLRATSRAASKMVDEVRRQFKEIPGLLRGR